MTGPPLLIDCPLGCGERCTNTDITLPEGALKRCLSCGQLVSQCNRSQYLYALDKWDTADGTNPASGAIRRHAKVSRRRLTAVHQLFGRTPSLMRLLDVGCSSGALLRVARQMGFDAEGVEPAARAAETARQHGLKVHHGLLHEQHFAAGYFHAITMFELIEHLPDPLAMLHECSRILCRGGVLAINTPNAASWTAKIMGARWENFDVGKTGGHISFFSPRSIRLAAQRGGMVVERIETRGVRFFEKDELPSALYAIAKLGSELLNVPSQIVGRGHDMLVFMSKRSSGTDR